MRIIGAIVMVAALVLGAGLVSTGAAATLNVASNGVDSATCGAASAPCRTISRAVTNAVAGDRIIVGPGVYGNLNHDADLTDANEEPPIPNIARPLLHITKRLTIESSAGAAMTILDATGANRRGVVWLEASGIVFGGRGRGFTVTGSDNGIAVIGSIGHPGHRQHHHGKALSDSLQRGTTT